MPSDSTAVFNRANGRSGGHSGEDLELGQLSTAGNTVKQATRKKYLSHDAYIKKTLWKRKGEVPVVFDEKTRDREYQKTSPVNFMLSFNDNYFTLVSQYPKGYSRLAAFLASADTVAIYKGFHYLHSRLLLAYQHDLCVLQEELLTLDDLDAEHGQISRLRCRSRDLLYERVAPGRPRQQVLGEIEHKLSKYSESVDAHREEALC